MADNFSSALSAWKGAHLSIYFMLIASVIFSGPEMCSPACAEINLSELQKTLDAQGVELVENQKESVVGRKALADKTRGAQGIQFSY
jgi:hypothetical protein